MKVYRNSVAENNKRYVDAHPELQQLLDAFVTAVITHKPPDIINFGLFFFNNIRSNGRFGPCPVIIAGPSGVGKGAIINRLLTTYPDIFGFSVSHTTRPPRSGEIDGVHYNFVTKGEFEEAVERGDFVEYAKVHTNFYGTSLQAIEKVCELFALKLKIKSNWNTDFKIHRSERKTRFVFWILIFREFKASRNQN